MKFGILILREIKFVANRCETLKLKCMKFNFGKGSVPDLARHLGEFKEPNSTGEEEKGWEWEGGKEREEGRRENDRKGKMRGPHCKG